MSHSRKQTVRKQEEFVFRLEFAPNADVIHIHTRKRFPQSSEWDMLGFADAPKSEKKKRHPFYAALVRIRGLVNFSSVDYEVQISKAKMFTWDELLPRIKKALQIHIAGGSQLKEIEPPLQG